MMKHSYDEHDDTKERDNYGSEHDTYEALARDDSNTRDETFIHDDTKERDKISVTDETKIFYQAEENDEVSPSDNYKILDKTPIQDNLKNHYDVSSHDDTQDRYGVIVHNDNEIRDDNGTRDEIALQEDNNIRNEVFSSDDTKKTRYEHEDRYETYDDNHILQETHKNRDIESRFEDSSHDYNSIHDEASIHDDIKAQYDTEVPYNDALIKDDIEIRDNKTTYDEVIHNETQVHNNSAEKNVSPGTRLRQVREQNNLSVKHIADRLFLDNRVIEALEADNYAALPPTLFVRGYLRNYAKLLEISPESIMDSLDQIQRQTQPSFTPQLKRKKQVSSRDLWPTIVTGIVIMASIILVALWPFFPNTDSNLQQSTQVPTENNGSSWSAVLPDSVFTPTMETEPVSPSKLEETRTNTSTHDLEVTTFSTTNNTEVVENSQPISETNNDTTDKPVTPITEEKTMRVHFKQRSWLRVTDNSGKKLYEGIINVGKILPLEGEPPFSLKVGNIDGVDIEYNGEINDVKTYPKRTGWKNLFIVGSTD